MYAQKSVFGSLRRVYENAFSHLILRKDMPWRCFGSAINLYKEKYMHVYVYLVNYLIRVFEFYCAKCLCILFFGNIELWKVQFSPLSDEMQERIDKGYVMHTRL